MGKSVGDDFREGKITLPVVLSYRRGVAEERNFWKRTLEDGNQTPDDLIYAQKLMERHDAIADTVERARHYGDIARDALAIFPDGPYKSALARSRRFLRRPRLLSSLRRGQTLMPFVSIRILAGHKQETKDRIAKGTVKAITEATGPSRRSGVGGVRGCDGRRLVRRAEDRRFDQARKAASFQCRSVARHHQLG